jgi:hypothetical protein
MAEHRLFSPLPTGRYVTVLLVTFLGLAALKELGGRAAQLTCWSGGYRQDAWMAYCNSTRYGVYDVEAIWHHAEPDVAPALQAAKIITLTDSHLQNALSLGGASQWFADRHYPTYMLGLPTEESGFGERLIDNFHLRPSVLILDASPYFTGDVGGSERAIFADPVASRKQVTELRGFQAWHQRLCDQYTWACGHNFAYFRSRLDGHWIFPVQSSAIWIGRPDVPNDNLRYPVSEAANERVPLYPQYLDAAKRLLGKLDIPSHCIVITHVPSEEDLTGLAEYVGAQLGLTVIVPVVPNLSTFDRSHLTPESSVQWSRQFLTRLEPVLERCISGKPSLANE